MDNRRWSGEGRRAWSRGWIYHADLAEMGLLGMDTIWICVVLAAVVDIDSILDKLGQWLANVNLKLS
jgi:hypothetical protein